jgi:hypothetical protein
MVIIKHNLVGCYHDDHTQEPAIHQKSCWLEPDKHTTPTAHIAAEHRRYTPSHGNHKKPGDHCKETMGLLLLQPVNVGLDEANLPNIWHKLADVNMKEARAIIQEQLQLQASSLGLPETMVTTRNLHWIMLLLPA